MSKSLPARPNLEQLKNQAKDLLKQCLGGEPAAVERVRAFHPDFEGKDSRKDFRLHDAQLVIAREYGFASWSKLKVHIETHDKDFSEKLSLFQKSAWLWGDQPRARAMLVAEPRLASADIWGASACGNHQRVAEFLKDNGDLATMAGGAKNWPPLLHACWSCFVKDREDAFAETVSLLLKHGADPNSFWTNADNYEESALYGTVENNSAKLARILLTAGADPNDGESLYHACEKFNLELLQALADHGLEKKAVSFCLFHVVDYQWETGVKWFLEQGADPNGVAHHGEAETPLHGAVRRNCSPAIIQTLLSAGADPNRRTKAGVSSSPRIKGYTPLDFALRLGRGDVADLLRSHGATASEQNDMDEFVIACANGDRRTAESTLKIHPDLMARRDELDRNLLASVAQMHSVAGTKLMVELGWNLEERSWMEGTPLCWAINQADPDLLKFLLEHGASTGPFGDYFKSAIHAVCHACWRPNAERQAECLRILLAHGVSIPEGLYPCGQKVLDEVLSHHLGQAAD